MRATKGERREAKRQKRKYAPVRHSPPGERRGGVKLQVTVRVNGEKVKT